MGRKSKGVLKVCDAHRLNITTILQNKPIGENNLLKGTVSWKSGSALKFILSLGEHGDWIILQYTLNFGSGKTFAYDCKVELQKFPSNLKIGYYYYFVCPVSGRKARNLYRFPGMAHWIHREALKTRIYYPSQLCSKMRYATNRYFAFKRQLDQLKTRGIKFHYRNRDTKTAKRFNYLYNRLNHYDYQRYKIMIYKYRKYFDPEFEDNL